MTTQLLLVLLFARVFAPSGLTFSMPWIEWNQRGPDLVTVRQYTYRLFIDGKNSTIVGVSGITVIATCTGTVSPFHCRATIPVLSSGRHRFIVLARDNAPRVHAAPLAAHSWDRVFIVP